MISKFLFFFCCCSLSIYAQSLTFSEFFNYSRDILDSAQLSGIKQFLPEKFVITGADFGDISGDTLNDFAIAVRPAIRRSKDIYVYIFVDSSKSYIPVFTDTLKFIELPIEIAFTISEKICLITQKLKDNSWLFTGYSYLNNELSLVDIYHTGDQIIDRRNKIGNEFYENFKTLNSFNGYYNQATLRQYKKNRFYNFPVYEQKRNIYKNYANNIYITSSWLWNDSLAKHINYGMIRFTRDRKFLIADISLNNKIFSSDSLDKTFIRLYFDRAPERLVDMTRKKEPVFRNSPDENIAVLNIEVNPANPSRSDLRYNLGKEYFSGSVHDMRISGERTLNNLNTSIRLPLNLFNTDTSEIGIYVSIEQIKENGSVLLLKSSDGDPDDPSSYGRLKFIESDEYYGSIVNHKFHELSEKLKKNSL